MTDLPLIRELLLPSTYCGNVTETLPRSAPIRPPHFAGREIEYLMAGWKKHASGPSSMGQILTPRPLHFACFGNQRGEQATVLPYRLRAAINCDFTLSLTFEMSQVHAQGGLSVNCHDCG